MVIFVLLLNLICFAILVTCPSSTYTVVLVLTALTLPAVCMIVPPLEIEEENEASLPKLHLKLQKGFMDFKDALETRGGRVVSLIFFVLFIALFLSQYDQVAPVRLVEGLPLIGCDSYWCRYFQYLIFVTYELPADTIGPYLSGPAASERIKDVWHAIWPNAILKVGFLLALLWVVLRRLARAYGIRESISPKELVTIVKGVQRKRDDGGAVITVPLGVAKQFGPREYFNNLAARVEIKWGGNGNQRRYLGNCILQIPKTEYITDFRIDRDSWEDVRIALQEGRGPPRRSFPEVKIQITPRGTGSVNYLLFDHPDRDARATGMVTLLTSLFAIVSAALFT